MPIVCPVLLDTLASGRAASAKATIAASNESALLFAEAVRPTAARSALLIVSVVEDCVALAPKTAVREGAVIYLSHGVNSPHYSYFYHNAKCMPLPDNYDPWKFLQSQLLTTYNLDVEQTFIGAPSQVDLTNPLSALKQACLLQPDDTTDITILRFMLYYFCIKGDLPTPVYGIPVSEVQSNWTFRPQVKMFFLEDYSFSEAAEHLPRASAEISFRLMNFTSQTINEGESRSLATRIKEIFGAGNGYLWNKGVMKVTYADPIHGYDFRLFVSSEAEAVRVIESVLSVQHHSFQEALVKIHQSRAQYPSVPPMQQVYGKSVRAPRKRPACGVRFKYAELLVQGLPNAVTLVDLTGKRRPLVK